jgi:hypothetical protein
VYPKKHVQALAGTRSRDEETRRREHNNNNEKRKTSPEQYAQILETSNRFATEGYTHPCYVALYHVVTGCGHFFFVVAAFLIVVYYTFKTPS